MNIDWSKAPEGATHYYKNSPQPWRDLSGCIWKYFSHGEWLQASSAGKSAWLLRELGTVLFARPLPQTWTGEGLPPVGTVCEYQTTSWPNDQWEVRTVRYISDYHVITAEKDGTERSVCADIARFSPIRTPEQIAANEREAAVNGMLCHDALGGSRRGLAEALYDAGYRLQVSE